MIAAIGQSPSIEANKANIHRFVDEALNRGILDGVDETRGEFAEQSKARIRAWRRAFPDFHTTIENIIAEGDWVAFHLRHEGTHQGEFLGVAPTGRRVDFRSIVCNRFVDGVVVENWGLHDHGRALEQLRSDESERR
jgi:predicted ester cyclase